MGPASAAGRYGDDNVEGIQAETMDENVGEAGSSRTAWVMWGSVALMDIPAPLGKGAVRPTDWQADDKLGFPAVTMDECDEKLVRPGSSECPCEGQVAPGRRQVVE